MDLVFNFRRKIFSGSHENLVVSDPKQSLMTFLMTEIQAIQDNDMKNELVSLVGKFQTDFSRNSLGTKYFLTKSYDGQYTCDGSGPEDVFYDLLEPMNLEDFYPHSKESFLMGLRNIFFLSNISSERPDFQKYWFGTQMAQTSVILPEPNLPHIEAHLVSAEVMKLSPDAQNCG